jgi:hypothetical protein
MLTHRHIARQHGSAGAYSIAIDPAGGRFYPDDPHPLADQIDRHAAEIEWPAPACVPLQDEAAAVAQQHPGFLDRIACRHRPHPYRSLTGAFHGI